jgi:chromosome segregation ATPase
MDYSANITRLRNEVGSLRGEIASIQQDIRRLQEAKSTLMEQQVSFHHEKAQLQEPGLTAGVWHGNEANDHDNKRTSLETSYRASEDQLEEIISSIERKINLLRSDIQHAHTLIDVKQSQVAMFKRLQNESG